VNDVAIIGVGIHQFGRFDKSAMEMGATAGSPGRPGVGFVRFYGAPRTTAATILTTWRGQPSDSVLPISASSVGGCLSPTA